MTNLFNLDFWLLLLFQHSLQDEFKQNNGSILDLDDNLLKINFFSKDKAKREGTCVLPPFEAYLLVLMMLAFVKKCIFYFKIYKFCGLRLSQFPNAINFTFDTFLINRRFLFWQEISTCEVKGPWLGMILHHYIILDFVTMLLLSYKTFPSKYHLLWGEHLGLLENFFENLQNLKHDKKDSH